MKRKVTFVLTKGSNRLLEVETEAQTWGELKAILADNKVETTNIIGIIESNRNQLEINEALLPAMDELVIHVFQHQMKSGSIEVEDMSRAEMIEEIKSVFSDKKAKEIFANYPQMKTDTMRAALVEWRSSVKEEPADGKVSTVEEIHQTIDRLSELVDMLPQGQANVDIDALLAKIKLDKLVATNNKLAKMIQPLYIP